MELHTAFFDMCQYLSFGFVNIFFLFEYQDFLQGDASKAKKQLGWEPKTKFDVISFFLVIILCGQYLLIIFKELVKEMVAADIELMKRNAYA